MGIMKRIYTAKMFDAELTGMDSDHVAMRALSRYILPSPGRSPMGISPQIVPGSSMQDPHMATDLSDTPPDESDQ